MRPRGWRPAVPRCVAQAPMRRSPAVPEPATTSATSRGPADDANLAPAGTSRSPGPESGSLHRCRPGGVRRNRGDPPMKRRISTTATIVVALLSAAITQAQTGTAGTVLVEIPRGAIVAFEAETCPPGWVPYGKSEGRFLIGSSETWPPGTERDPSDHAHGGRTSKADQSPCPDRDGDCSAHRPSQSSPDHGSDPVQREPPLPPFVSVLFCQLLPGAENSPPLFVGHPPRALEAFVDRDNTVDLANFFYDSDPGDTLTLHARTATPHIFDVVAVTGIVLTLHGHRKGTGTLSVTAADQAGTTATGSIRVNVKRSP